MSSMFIPGNVPSSKNNRVWTGKYFVESKACKKWRKETAKYWKEYKVKFLQDIAGKKFPLKIGLHFVRGTKHAYDWVNPVQTIQDEMVKHGWLEDDNVNIMFPVPMKIKNKYSTYSKEEPGVWIKIY